MGVDRLKRHGRPPTVEKRLMRRDLRHWFVDTCYIQRSLLKLASRNVKPLKSVRDYAWSSWAPHAKKGLVQKNGWYRRAPSQARLRTGHRQTSAPAPQMPPAHVISPFFWCSDEAQAIAEALDGQGVSGLVADHVLRKHVFPLFVLTALFIALYVVYKIVGDPVLQLVKVCLGTRLADGTEDKDLGGAAVFFEGSRLLKKTVRAAGEALGQHEIGC